MWAETKAAVHAHESPGAAIFLVSLRDAPTRCKPPETSIQKPEKLFIEGIISRMTSSLQGFSCFSGSSEFGGG